MTLTAMDYSITLPYNLLRGLRNAMINVRRAILTSEIRSRCSVLYQKDVY